MQTKITQNMKAIILGLVVALGAGYVSAWTGPSSAPTGGNVAAPVNISDALQTKSGILNLAHLITSDLTVTNSDATVTNIPSGSVLVADGNNTGKVKWGTASASTTVTSGTTVAGTWFQIGNMLIEGGKNYPGTGKSIQVVFPKPFANLVSLNFTMLQSGTGGSKVHDEEYVHATNVTNTSFYAGTSENNGYSWMAIGTAQ